MAADKVLNLLDLTTAGREVDLNEIAKTDAPLAFAYAKDPPLHLTRPAFLNRVEFATVFPEGDITRAAPMLCVAHDCFLMGPFGHVVLPSGQLIRQSVLNLDGGAIQYTLDQFKGQFPGAKIPWSSTPNTVFAANGYGSNNYFHFLIDCLPQLDWHARAPGLESAKTVLTGYPPEAEATLPFMAGAMTAAKVDARRLQPFDGTLMFCRKIIFPRRTTGASVWKTQWLRHHFGLAGKAKGQQRLYIARGNVPRRRIVNEADVVKLLDAHGFRAVDPGALSVAEQAALFSDAGIVVGAHGAALTNAIFMGEGASLIELTHTDRVVNTYHEVASAAKLTYACIVGDVVGDRSQPVFSDFTVDVAALETALTRAF